MFTIIASIIENVSNVRIPNAQSHLRRNRRPVVTIATSTLEDVFRVRIPNAKSRTHGNTVLEHTFARIMDHPDATHVRILHVEKRTQRKGVPTYTISMSMKPPEYYSNAHVLDAE